MKNIIIPDEKNLERIINQFITDGKEKIHIITDFDRTLTKAFLNNMKNPTLIAQIREGKYLSKDYPKKAYALFDKYHPIEINPNIEFKEKSRKMHEWWKKHFDLLIESGMNKEVIEDIIKRKKMHFREGIKEFFNILIKDKIPLIIMSAAPGDMILEYLKEEKLFYSNIHVIANMFIWDKNGKAIGVKEPIIHSLNKQEIELKTLTIYKTLLKRKNVILLGDNLEDTGMIEGFPYQNLIKVGFLNENKEENLENFKKKYDVIITDDGDFYYIIELMKRIIKI